MQTCILLIGLNHRSADVQIREAFALNAEVAEELRASLSLADEIFILSTCNRVELLVVGKSYADMTREILQNWSSICQKNVENLEPYVYIYKADDAIKHLFQVASSLDSMVLGEPQILGQMKQAFQNSNAAKSSKLILNKIMHKAFYVAKKIRTETALAQNAVSISYAAVELGKRIFGDMKGHAAMLIGAGDMAELAATHLMQVGISQIIVCNRTLENAKALSEKFNGRAIELSALQENLHEVDIVISSTGAQDYVIKADEVKAALYKRKHRPMFFIDIAVPRDIEPEINELDNVYVYDIDDLNEVVENNRKSRLDEAQKAYLIVEKECEDFMEWLEGLKMQPTIVSLIDKHRGYAKNELEKTLKKLNLDDQQAEKIELMVNAIVNKINHDPISFLKSQNSDSHMSAQTIDVTKKIFKL